MAWGVISTYKYLSTLLSLSLLPLFNSIESLSLDFMILLLLVVVVVVAFIAFCLSCHFQTAAVGTFEAPLGAMMTKSSSSSLRQLFQWVRVHSVHCTHTQRRGILRVNETVNKDEPTTGQLIAIYCRWLCLLICVCGCNINLEESW